MDIWWLVMTRVSYWWMRTNLTLTVMKLDVMCLLAHLYFHVVIHSGKVSWGLSGTCRYWRCFMGPKVWFVHYDDKFWSGNTVKGIQAQQGWNYVQIHGWYRYWKKKRLLKRPAFSCPDWIGRKQTCLPSKLGLRYIKRMNVFLLSWPASSFGEGGIKWR